MGKSYILKGLWGITAIIYVLIVSMILLVPHKPSYASVLKRQTTEGMVIGLENKDSQTISWRGIPYAKPPIGPLRWKAPQPPVKRTLTLQTDMFCEICPQFVEHDLNPNTPQVVQGNEDCLYLNIWAPKTTQTSLPVFFWIHGGGNSIQYPLFKNHDLSKMANRGNMVIVSINYRIGPMGFLNHPAIKTNNKESDSGNFGILDQIAALKWVQANIKNFGGDPDNVTIAGVSAGAMDVLCLVVSPLAKGLFHRAISQSATYRAPTPEEGKVHTDEILSRMVVNDGSAADKKEAEKILASMTLKTVETYLRSKTAKAFLHAYPEGSFRGLIQIPSLFADGHVLPEDFYGALAAGEYNKVPLMLGSNKDEVKLFARTYTVFAEWKKDFSLFSDPEKIDLYNKVAKYQSDAWKFMAVDEPARLMTAVENQPPIYTYQFLWGAGGTNGTVLSKGLSILLGACHIAEIDFVFGTEKASLGRILFNDQNKNGRIALSGAMMGYWSQFARTGDPNVKGSQLPTWKPWSNSKGPKMLLLDADLHKARISMSETEVTRQSIKRNLKAEKMQAKIQPYLDKFPFWIP